MKYLIYSLLLFALTAEADELLPEGTQVEAEPVPPSLALPVENPVATVTAVSTAIELAPLAPAQALEMAIPAQEPAGNLPYEVPAEMAKESAVPVDITAQQAAPPPIAVEPVNYGPSAEEGYGSVGLKNEGGILEVGGEREDPAPHAGERKTSSVPENAL